MKRIKYFTLFIIIHSFFACNSINKKKAELPIENEIHNNGLEEIEAMEIEEDTLRIFPLYTDQQYKISIKEIDSTEYNSAHKQYFTEYKRALAIQSTDSIAAELEKINASFTLGLYESLIGVKFANGDSIYYGHDIDEGCFSEIGIIAYYPEYHFLHMEGGHSSEMGVNVLTGEDILEVGNPATQLYSPNRKFRFSDVFSGQECSTFIFQKIEDGEMIKLFEIDDFNILCYYIESFWTDDYNLYYKTDVYSNAHRHYKLAVEKL